jgi:hypothetical protein
MGMKSVPPTVDGPFSHPTFIIGTYQRESGDFPLVGVRLPSG